MKNAPSAALILLLGHFVAVAGCADQERPETADVAYVPPTAPGSQPASAARAAAPAGAQSVATGSLPAADARAAIERAQRSERAVYAQGLERILVSNGMPASVRVHEEGQAGPTPALMFFGHFEPSFVKRAVTDGAVLERARALGFRSVEFIGRGPDGNFLFELARTGPLPKCAAYNRLCL
jgi:hypothetical protein